MQAVLKQNRETGIRVLVVWVSMLPTDWARPSGMVQSRISDSRVAQFWDKNNLVAKAMDKQLSPSLQPSCCRRGGVLWDLAALYPVQVPWENAVPAFVNGPVVAVATDVQQRLSKKPELGVLTPE